MLWGTFTGFSLGIMWFFWSVILLSIDRFKEISPSIIIPVIAVAITVLGSIITVCISQYLTGNSAREAAVRDSKIKLYHEITTVLYNISDTEI